MFYATVHSDSLGHMMNNKQPKTNQQITSESQNDRHQVALTLVPASKNNWDSFFSLFLQMSHSGEDAQTGTVCLRVFTSMWRGEAGTSASLVPLMYTTIWFSLGQQTSRECRKNTGEGSTVIQYPCSGSHKALLIYIFIYSLYIKQWKNIHKTKNIRACS